MASLKFKEILCLLYSALLFISGVLLIGFSVVLSYKIFYHFKFIPSSSIGPFIVIFLLGFVHLFLTWLGIKGPTREHDLHIILFIIITVILLIVECSVGIWSIVLWKKMETESSQLMEKSFDELVKTNFGKESWESLQTKLKCCGLSGFEDYKQKNQDLPFSCFNLERTNNVTYNTGCKQPLARYAKRLLIDAAIMGFCCCVFQALGVFAFCVFFKALKAERSARAQRRLEVQRRISQQNGNASANPTPSSPPPVVPPTSP